MLFNAVKASVFLSAVEVVFSASTPQGESVNAVKRHYRPDARSPCHSPSGYGCQSNPGYASNGRYSDLQDSGYGGAYGNGYGGAYGNGYGGGYAGAGAGFGAGASVGLNAMVQGWSSLSSGFNQLQSTFSGGASVEAAIQAAVSLRSQVQTVTSQYSSCGCSASPQTSSAFQNMAVQFFSSVQVALQAGQARYGYAWENQFRPIFQQYASAFVSLKAIAASVQVDLAVVLQRARINAQLFASVGLNLAALLQVNLSLGGIVGL